jgi:hypothetical protein
MDPNVDPVLLRVLRPDLRVERNLAALLDRKLIVANRKIDALASY